MHSTTGHPPGAYRFLLDALENTRKHLSTDGHVSGQELLLGIRLRARELFGPLAFMVFDEWNIHEGNDFGEMVFELVDQGILSKMSEDKLEDFATPQHYQRYYEEEYFSHNREEIYLKEKE
ncbi:MAG: hypothetical protein QF492_08625 [Candidatus Krumholzibacteria bacterium]|jgi:uncharacterized repeat protein (TIGR04138 family)|nr:hypothetical protein [Candidatus Krumholzibacteria bacterium]MDP6669951.1 hypothetical protein [Candidatus Krumholzibacteria bacterium]MDP6797720.1 hypothetical protein [Candidatus Krumholzibacteria bacterium]MDP7020825.1 hypothetical protein [Candidatus Krumholzibacteria bacterium]